MNKRTINYLKKAKARKIVTHVLDVDLNTFLSATLELSSSNTVKKHIQNALYRLDGYKMRMSA